MPQYTKDRGLGELLAELTDRVARLERRQPIRYDAGGMSATSFHGLVYEDTASPSWTTYFQTVVRPRHAASLGLVFLGDQVGATNTGGAWRVQIAGTPVAGASGSVPPTFTYQFAALTLDLSGYSPTADLLIEVQGQRTSGATTGGRYSTGGTLGMGVRWFNLS